VLFHGDLIMTMRVLVKFRWSHRGCRVDLKSMTHPGLAPEDVRTSIVDIKQLIIQ